MRRATTNLALTLCLLACDSVSPPPDRVELVTTDPFGAVGCWLMPIYGELIADPEFGVALNGGAPAVWPSSYTGRRVGSEVEVVDSDQNVVARTGIGVQMIFWGGGEGPNSGRYICQAARAEEHLQPSPGNAAAP